MSTIRITWRGDAATVHAADNALSEVLDPPADAVSLLKEDSSEADSDTPWTLHAYFEHDPDADAVTEAFAAFGLNIGPGEREVLEDRDWVAHALEGLGIVEAGPFVVYGRHDADKAAALPGHHIQIEANRAFGTGHHPTTAGCLEMLAEVETAAPSRILDLGTGSALLAIAARRLWPHATVLGTDIDEPSVAIGEENAELNGAQGITFRVADGVDESVRREGPFDLVMANILAEPLVDLAPDVAAVTAPGGRILLAGLLDRQEAAVIEAYAAEGFAVTLRGGNVWPILLLERHAERGTLSRM
ncbi:50S ribosomal protein L11 methyltransferase [Parvularcula dongshanensis]|uniref:Ribosomal protein L11 methyltransferase n=1 Tax=Parvularcula dongshanensis TaxID=1173995 RepID=A0A840I6D8_9PROT|nr:50S ribosomal protein L11 methyltransferase [Parvularcula dongshanensis]MBB4659831.1 ribosomal protein L11 methyltransferase [Parvularcula dongshanensis]